MLHMWKDCEIWDHIFAGESDESSFVTHLIAVVGSAEDSYAVAIVHDLIPIWLHLNITTWSKISVHNSPQ